jgi:hypothetical protein
LPGSQSNGLLKESTGDTEFRIAYDKMICNYCSLVAAASPLLGAYLNRSVPTIKFESWFRNSSRI